MGAVLAVLFGAIFTMIATVDLFWPGLAPQLGQRTRVTLRVPYGPVLVHGAREQGDVRGGGAEGRTEFGYRRIVVPRQTVLDEDDPAHLDAFAYESTRRPPALARVLGVFGVHAISCAMITAYLRRFGQNRVRLLRTQVGIFALATLLLAGTKALFLLTALPEFWAPMSMLSLFIALAFDRRTSFLLDVGMSFIAASFLRFDPIFLAAMMVRGVASTLLFFDRKHPRQMIVAGTLAGVASALVYAAMTVVFEGTASLLPDLFRGLESNTLACVGGGLASGLLGSILHEPAQLAMGHVSRERLLDLTDLEQPLLRKMSAEAPGSWEHARAMANLAEAASAAIGADALLTRVGAYYHDLGKTIQPKYFVENLAPGEQTPHEALEPDVSADAIMAHVVLGTKILRQGRIPEPVVEFAYTHHGTQVVEFFWHKCQAAGNPKGLTADYFRYPGMKPQTKETAILMLVDSIEAASRTIFPPEHGKFEEMIRRVVFTKLAAGQLDESGLSLEDLRVLTSRMAHTLVNMYHGRIKYPWQREAEARAEAEKAAKAGASPSGGEGGEGGEKASAGRGDTRESLARPEKAEPEKAEPEKPAKAKKTERAGEPSETQASSGGSEQERA